METSSYNDCVFINCPFDTMYWPLFEAITFSVMHCGFVPRCALEVEDGSEVRIQKIKGIIRECRLAIHDISRTECDGDPPLPRFNMPLELGLFMGAKEYGVRDQKRKAAVVLDTERYRYQRFISDVAGHDVCAHAEDVLHVIRHVRNFLLSHTPRSVFLPGPERIADRYQDFRAALPRACAALHVNPESLTFHDLTRLIHGYMQAQSAMHDPAGILTAASAFATAEGRTLAPGTDFRAAS
ncbi:MAG TPA: hypothetical protein VF665_07765 [Longimicrobium sp.]|jgi:hypothetical protein|uniref:hypothetical protein n=1 Tax=Longimicrobium sp. TaxID=2029185 RepID=UPI002ED8FDE8